jgi:hypothetical protein
MRNGRRQSSETNPPNAAVKARPEEVANQVNCCQYSGKKREYSGKYKISTKKTGLSDQRVTKKPGEFSNLVQL